MKYAPEVVRKISTIFLDSGKTLRMVVPDAEYQMQVQQQLYELVGTKESPEDFFTRLSERYDTYKRMARGMMLQSSEMELWTRWMLPDLSAEAIAPIVPELTRLWHTRKGRHTARPDVKATVVELNKRGYTLGIIANSISTLEIPAWLEADGLTQYFKAVILSSNFGRRKPDVHIFLDSAYEAGVKPANCAYIGDDPTIDIKGARQAGFGMILLLNDADNPTMDATDGIYKADGIIRSCSDLLEIFPAR